MAIAFVLPLVVGLFGSPQPNVSDDFLVTEDRAGRLILGVTVDRLYDEFGRSPTRLVDLDLEGHFSPAIEILLDDQKDEPALIAEIDKVRTKKKSNPIRWGVWRVLIYDNRFRTSRGVGVGSSLGDIRKHYTVKGIGSGEGNVVALVEEEKISFGLDRSEIPQDWWGKWDQSLIPDEVKVTSLLIHAVTKKIRERKKTEQELVRLEDKWARAVQETDTDTLDQIIAYDYVGTTADGRLQNKREYLAAFTSGARKTTSLTTKDLRVKIYGDAAVLTHGGSAEGEHQGRIIRGSYRWTHVFVSRNGQWQAVANHLTRLAEE